MNIGVLLITFAIIVVMVIVIVIGAMMSAHEEGDDRMAGVLVLVAGVLLLTVPFLLAFGVGQL